MSEIAVVNASPLIFLSKAGLLEFLQLAGKHVHVPEAVAREIERRGASDVTVRALESTPWLHRVEVPAIAPVILSWDLGPGESAVLAHARTNPGMVAIIDDGAGRRCAETLGIPLRGTLGLVLLAKRAGHIAQARPVVESLRREGMYLSDGTLDRALALVGE